PLPEFWEFYRHQPGNKIPLFRNPEDPAEVISNMLFYRKRRSRIEKSLNTRLKESALPEKDKYQFQAGYLRQSEVKQIVEDYHLPVVKSLNLKPSELTTIPEKFLPAVLKGISCDVIHKSEFNAVRLNLLTREEIKSEAQKMTQEFAAKGFSVEGFLIQPYVKVKHEILLGGFRDPSFGPMIMFGTGGKYVEVFNDTVIKSAYVSDADINEMIKMTKIGQIIKGVRGEVPADIRCLRETIKAAARMIIENKRIQEFDINPLVVTETNQVFAVDIRIRMGE
ncbi:MAG TPA: acetate--CoA ligase family protein, partial [Ignavibacteriales bacterium]|nr:acetate--CoA ligase family protein [Ignavibacteriales bacterium]